MAKPILKIGPLITDVDFRIAFREVERAFNSLDLSPLAADEELIRSLIPAPVKGDKGDKGDPGDSNENIIQARLTVDNAALSVVLAAVTNLVVHIEANEAWTGEFFVAITLATTTATFGLQVTAPVGATGFYSAESTNGAPDTGTGVARRASQSLGTAVGTGQFGVPGSSAAIIGVIVKFSIVNGATAGDIGLSMNSSAGNLVVKANSRVDAWRE